MVRAELGTITKHNLKMVKRLNQVIFPVSYNDQFYNDLLKAGDLAKIAFFNDLAVGAVCCRVDISPPPNTTAAPDAAAAPNGTSSSSQNPPQPVVLAPGRRLYIMTLGCLAPYRRQKIGTLLLQHVLAVCAREGFSSVTLHVQINNDAALQFYKKFGFEVVGISEHYYKRIEPADAYLLEKKLGTPSVNGHAGKAHD
ncbi:N-alpha-acetyltransferase 50-like [Paramacrobiotus metropolitanus]|uniref:N-alpha-acetyltransferase 50-like n=1 Tax=Paramacrobiotus metropolitanus TaxID=2943436 RepID=UPI0024458D2D|nr:N-alpha-acetyltransferase 50-like [Paramacrobiotus metropolitanus]